MTSSARPATWIDAQEARFPVLGVPFTLCGVADAVERIRDMIESGRSHQVVLANAHTLNLAADVPAYRRILTEADLVLRDGVGVELAARLAGIEAGHNFVGTDFVPELLGRLGPRDVRVFLFGAEPGVAERAAEGLRARDAQGNGAGTAPEL